MTFDVFARRAACLSLTALLAAWAIGPTQADPAKPFLHPLFTDNMVLQRGMADPVWGWTTPGQAVTVTFEGKSTTATAGADGKWTAKIGPFAAGGPYTLTVTGAQTVTLTNVMVGDVWLCSGQSNMEFGVGNVINAGKEIAAANYPNIRLYTVNKTPALAPQALISSGPWQATTPETIKSQGTWSGFSAVGYFFGRDLQQEIHVPIGLLLSSWGGTPAEAWTSESALRKNSPEFDPRLDQINDTLAATPADLEQRIVAWYTKSDPGTSGNWQDPAFDDSAWSTLSEPGFFDGGAVPELKGVDGVVWLRRTFDVPAGDAGKDAVLHLLVDDNDTTWVNGTQVGAAEGNVTARAYPVPAALLKPTGNVIAVRALDTGGDGGIWGDPSSLVLNFGGDTLPLTGTWRAHLGVTLAQAGPLPVAVNSSPNNPTELYNGMINPLLPFGIKGVIWYQGEANSGNPGQYRTLLPSMIGDWRTHWSEGNFPFLIVQLAGWQPGGDSWPQLRQAQMFTAQTVPNTGITTAIDIGNQSDIHPKNKQEVGRRLALVAEAKAYGEKVDYTGPVFKAITITGGEAHLRFDHLGGGLVAKDGGPLTAFEIAGADGKYVAADAKIDGDSVVVSSPQVPSPVSVRYAWSAYPACSLYSKAGLPAFPFDTGGK